MIQKKDEHAFLRVSFGNTPRRSRGRNGAEQSGKTIDVNNSRYHAAENIFRCMNVLLCRKGWDYKMLYNDTG